MALLGWWLSGDGGLALLHATWELDGAMLLGTAIGLPAAWLTGRLRPGEPTQVEAIALILLLAGASAWLGVSALLAAERFPEHGPVLLSAVVASTVVFESLGPLLVRRVLR